MDDSLPARLRLAAGVLAVRGGASPAEVMSAFRRLAREAHPDTGGGTVEQLEQLVAARDLLLAYAGPDRRRRRREATDPQVLRRAVLRRRDRWSPEPPASSIDVTA